MLLFLDFDGTLHPKWEFPETGGLTARPYRGPWLKEAPILSLLLAPLGDEVQIVVSSRWAYMRDLEELKSQLPDDVAMRVIDSIWLSELITSTWSEYSSAQATKHACIRLWLERRRPDSVETWLALDDEDHSWPDVDIPHLFHARGTLANPDVQRELVKRLARMSGSLVLEQRLLDGIAVVQCLREQSGLGTTDAVNWYRNEMLQELGGRTAEQLVVAGRSDSVMSYIHNLSAGATG